MFIVFYRNICIQETLPGRETSERRATTNNTARWREEARARLHLVTNRLLVIDAIGFRARGKFCQRAALAASADILGHVDKIVFIRVEDLEIAQ